MLVTNVNMFKNRIDKRVTHKIREGHTYNSMSRLSILKLKGSIFIITETGRRREF